MVSFRSSVLRRIPSITVLITLQIAWIVSISASFQTNPLIRIQKPNFGHLRERRLCRPKQLTPRLAASNTANDNNDASFDMEELRQRIRIEQQKQRPLPQPSKLLGHSQWRSQQLQSSEPPSPLEYVYIVSFPEKKSSSPSQQRHPGGIHSIEYPSGKNVILAFTSQKSCDQFVLHLRQQQFFHPMTVKMSVEALVELCLNVGVLMELIPDGIDVLPPKQHVPQFGLQQQQQQQSSIHEHRRIQQQREKVKFAYYMLDDTDDFDDEGVLLDYAYGQQFDDVTPGATTALSVFD